MSYKTHEFLSGAKLTAEQLNEMDNQIKANADGVSLFTMDTITAVVKKLKLQSDGGVVGLYLDDTLISDTEVGDLSGLIPCEGLSVTSPTGDTITLQAGGNTVTIATSVTPSDCNQTVRFRSGDIAIANVTSAGVLSGKKLGVVQVTVACDKFSKTFTVNVWEQARPDWVGGNWVTAPYTLNEQTGMSVDTVSSQKRALTYPYTDQKGIHLNAGNKITVTCSGDYAIQYYYILTPGTGGLTYTTVAHNGAIFVVVDSKNGGSVTSNQPTSAQSQNLTYTATAECYFCLCVMHKSNVNQEFTEDELASLNENVVCKVEVS